MVLVVVRCCNPEKGTDILETLLILIPASSSSLPIRRNTERKPSLSFIAHPVEAVKGDSGGLIVNSSSH